MSRYAATFINPQGPGDARPTAMQIVQDEDLVGKLFDKVVFITGANQGIGLEAARALHATGATIFLGVRDLKKGQQAIDDIVSSSGNSGQNSLHLIEISLDSIDSIRAAAETFLAQSSKLNILINNAGVMASPQGRTQDGFETQLGINHLGHFLLFDLLRSTLLASSTPSFNSRVIVLSSMGHRGGEVRFHDLNFEEESSYDPWVAYGQAKTATIYFANEIEKRYGAKGLHALSLHPGTSFTNLGQYLDPEYVKSWSADKEAMRYMKTAQQGAATTVWAAISKDWEGQGGRYLVDCAVQGPAKPQSTALDTSDLGYAPWAFDQEKAAKLWKVSCELVGIQNRD